MSAVHATRDGGRIAGARFIDPEVLARIGNLDLVARIVVDGFVSGLHRARHLGVSTDFAEHRAYTPGDDVRLIDWRVYARTDRLYVKAFEAETNADVVIALDVSRSMDFGSRGITKLDYARFLAASLAHLGSRQRDRVGLALFDEGLVDVIPPAVRHRDPVLHALERARPGGAGDLERAMSRLGAGLTRRGIVVLISDLYAEPEAFAAALDALALRGHDVIVTHVLDPLELDPALDEAGLLEDLETGERLPVAPAELRAAYAPALARHLGAIASACAGRRIDHARFDTSRPLDEALFRYLFERARLARRS